MQLVFSTWPEVEAYRSRSTGVIIPIGATEQHGPTGFIGTDAICAEIIARGVGDATGALVAPGIAVGMSVHHTAFPGSMTLRPTTLVQVIIDSVVCLARQGFERFHFINGHGGNVASLQVASWEMYSLLPAMGFAHPERIRFKFDSWYELESVRAVSRELFGDQEGAHATPSEISLAMYAFPDRVKKHPPLPPTVEGRSTGYGPADFRASFPDGRLSSNPNLADPAHGKRVLDVAVKDLAMSYRTFMEEY
jgi:creatinine amidohydrolase